MYVFCGVLPPQQTRGKPEFQEKRALIQALGGNGQTWSPRIPESLRQEFGEFARAPTWKLRVLLDSVVQETDSRRWLVIGSTPDDSHYGSHIAGALISAFSYRPHAGTWIMDAGERYLAVSGTFGTPPSATTVRLAPSVYGFTLSSGFTAQGETTTYTDFYSLVSDRITCVLHIQTSYQVQRAADVPGTHITTNVHFGPGTSNGFYDLTLQTMGVDLSSTSAPTRIKEVQTCHFSGAVYQCPEPVEYP